jgi:cbb3-type cytochrome oxidase subunit 3
MEDLRRSFAYRKKKKTEMDREMREMIFQDA